MDSKETPFLDPETSGNKVNSRSKLISRERSFRIAVIVLVPLLIALIIALIVVIVLGKKSSPAESSTRGVCSSVECVKAASYLLDAMNPDVDPCEDFYEFSCGKWIQSNPQMFAVASDNTVVQRMMYASFDSEANNTNLPTSIRKIMQAYKVCIDYDGITIAITDWIRKKLVDVGGWPMIEDLWWKDEWQKLFAKAYSTFKLNGPIDIVVSYNPFDTANNIIHVRQPLQTMKINTQSVIAVAELLSNKNNFTFYEEMKDVERLEQLIANLSKSVQALTDDENDSKVMTVEDLERIIPSISWMHFLRNILRPYLKATDVIKRETKVYVMGITYLKTIIGYLEDNTITQKTLVNYAVSSFINSFLTLFPPVSSNSENKIIKIEQNARCFLTFMNIRPVMDYVYSKHRKEKTIDRKVITYMFEALRDMVKESTWLDDSTKDKVREKLDAVVLLKDFPPWSSDPKELDEYFKYLPIMTRNSFENKLNIDNYIHTKDLQLLTERNDRNKWPRTSEVGGSMANAFHNEDLNQIILAAGIQNLPFFDSQRPTYMNFAGMGLVVGHEITHGFDKIGSLRDKHGNRKNWWTARSKAEFEKKAKCFIDQYDAFDYGRSGYETLSENIADNGGLREAYLGFKKWERDNGKENLLPGFVDYSIDQLFFLSFARPWCDSRDPKELAKLQKDNHSANRMRVLACLQNMKEFSEAFKCKSGSTMNPRNKCAVW